MKEMHRKYLARHTVTSSLSRKDGDGDPRVTLIKLPSSTGSHSTYWVYLKFWFFPYLSISSYPFRSRTQWAQNLEPVGLGSGSSSATSWVTSGESLTSQTWKFPCHVLHPSRAGGTGRSLWRGGEADARQRHEARGTGRQTVILHRSTPEYKQGCFNNLRIGCATPSASQHLPTCQMTTSTYTQPESHKGRGMPTFSTAGHGG